LPASGGSLGEGWLSGAGSWVARWGGELDRWGLGGDGDLQLEHEHLAFFRAHGEQRVVGAPGEFRGG